MKDIRFLITLLLLTFAGKAGAEPLDEEQARYAAAAFFHASSPSTKVRARGHQLALRSRGHEAGYYVFERPEGGVVFVADDDAIGRTVLGYTDEGSYDAENIPVGLQDWLRQVTVLMQAVHEGKITKSDVRRKSSKVMVQALIRTQWNQGTPYNNLCPMLNGQRCITGCVATAMAQVMKYWEWPKHGYGSMTYYDPGCGQTLSRDFTESEYDWDNMREKYSSGTSDGDAWPVATLMRDCGYAVEMNYTPSESGACVSAYTMETYFHYSSLATDRYVRAYPVEKWHEFIREDLLAGRPVLYSGQSSSGGHEFIIDGFDTEDYYHVNWGWGGYQDGWFILTALNGYNEDQWMINCLEPDYTDETTFSYSLSADGTLTINGKGMMPQDYALSKAPWKESREAIRKIVIGDGITSIVDDFGSGSTWSESYENLEEVVLPEGLKLIGGYAFRGASKLTHVEIPSTVESMMNAFYGCRNLTSLRLPKGVMEFEDYLPGLVDLSVDEENPWLSMEDGVLYSKDLRCLLFVPEGLTRVVVSEKVEELYDGDMFRGTPLFFKNNTAPALPYSVSGYSSGTLYIPYGSTGYTAWKTSLPDWIIVTYSDMSYFLDTKVNWLLQDGTLSLFGWGDMLSAEYGYYNAPYAEHRNEVRKLVVGEGITSLCWDEFWGYDMTEVVLPATLNRIANYCFGYTDLNTITCYAKQAPNVQSDVFYNIPTNGTLRVPEGADYSSWLAILPSGWTVECFTPEPQIQAYGYDGEQAVMDLDAWEKLLATTPNAVGVVAAGSEYMAYTTRNLLVASSTEGDGYTCPYFRLTDLTSGYSSAAKAPQTGFHVPVAFKVKSGEYSRRLYAGYNTVCLPFAVSEDDLPSGCRMYGYSHFDSENNDAVFTAQTATEAGRVCFVTSEADAVWQVDLAGMTIDPVPPSVEDDQVRGTFVSTDAYQGIGYNPRSFDNVFAPLGQYLHPFRACFLMTAPAAGKLCIRLLEEGEADAVSNITATPTAGRHEMFTLDGRCLASPRKGQPYIKNGKVWIE